MSEYVEIKASLPKAYSKSSSDIYDEQLKNARDVGNLHMNRSRLNVITTLSKGEKEDWFKTTAYNNGKFRLSAINVSKLDKENDVDSVLNSDGTSMTSSAESAPLTDVEKKIEELKKIANPDYEPEKKTDPKAMMKGQNLRVEVYVMKGNRQVLVATNDDSDSKNYKNFEDMVNGDYKVQRGTELFIHVATEDGKRVDDDTLYALQFQMGTKYTENYTTKETTLDHDMSQAKLQQKINAERVENSEMLTTSGASLALSGANDILSDGLLNLDNIKNGNSGSILDILI
ncbi:MAG: hypothetical protein MJ247_07270 [Alphaproteobacteria bacterium]|nr:hypothetical protein [Alphaproteobacteria bacterium]